MSFKKLDESLRERLAQFKITAPTAFQSKALSLIRGGGNIYGIAPKDAGKTTAMIISIIQKLKKASIDDAPRALIIVENKEQALALEAEIKKLLYPSDLLMYTVYEEQKINAQRDELYEGVDIVIATPKRLTQLYYLNGINLNKLEMLFVDNASLLLRNSNHAELIRLSESITKCQYILLEDAYDKRFAQFDENFMARATVLEV